MKSIKIFLFDARNGLNKALFLCPIVIAAVAFIDLSNKIYQWGAVGVLPGNSASYGDYWLYHYGGMKEYIPGPSNPFMFPVMWIVLFLSISFIVLNYPFKDMQTVGQQILIRTRGRSRWWLSKCFWNISCTVFYHLLIALAILLLCLFFKVPITNHINIDLVKMAFRLERDTPFIAHTSIPFSVFGLPLLMSIGVNLFQMTISLFIKPVFSFLFVAIVMLSSAYLLSPYMIGNYAMPVRYNWILQGGVSHTFGIFLSLALIILSVLAGLLRFRRYDILNRE